MRELPQFLILAAFPCGVLATPFKILPLTYQSKGLTFNDWISLLTLCFAPLIAHVLAGVPKIVYLSQNRPGWRDKFVLYNPTTILWRYFAIADRRIRAKHWSAADMAASNPYFWTRRGWDGSEALSRKSQAFCVSLPDGKHVTLISESTLKTVIVTLQGADALYFLLKGYLSPSSDNYQDTVSIGSIFFPLAIFGLLRLIACFWLTEDFVYTDCEELQTRVARASTPEQIELVPRNKLPPIELLNNSDAWTGEDYRPPNSWQSWLFRSLFFLSILSLIVLAFMDFIPPPNSGGQLFTMTVFTLIISYIFFLTISAILYGYYFVRSCNDTTVLPCAASLWYQIYTGVLLAIALLLLIFASIETRKSECGYFTTWPNDEDPCAALPTDKNAIDGIFGVAIVGNITALNFTQPEGAMSVLFADGICQGSLYPRPDGTGFEGFQFINSTDCIQT
jgi:hypothetical protein